MLSLPTPSCLFEAVVTVSSGLYIESIIRTDGLYGELFFSPSLFLVTPAASSLGGGFWKDDKNMRPLAERCVSRRKKNVGEVSGHWSLVTKMLGRWSFWTRLGLFFPFFNATFRVGKRPVEGVKPWPSSLRQGCFGGVGRSAECLPASVIGGGTSRHWVSNRGGAAAAAATE